MDSVLSVRSPESKVRIGQPQWIAALRYWTMVHTCTVLSGLGTTGDATASLDEIGCGLLVHFGIHMNHQNLPMKAGRNSFGEHFKIFQDVSWR